MTDDITATMFQSLVLAGYGDKTNGSTEFPFGRFSVIEIPDEEEKKEGMRGLVFSDKPDEAEAFNRVAAGWYFIVQANDGTVYANPCRNEADANKRYDRLMRAYTKWITTEETDTEE